MDDLKGFLRDLSRLSRRYGMYIGGCGCCGSPYLARKNGDVVSKELSWKTESGKYEVR